MGRQKKELGEVAIRSHMFLGMASYSKPLQPIRASSLPAGNGRRPLLA